MDFSKLIFAEARDPERASSRLAVKLRAKGLAAVRQGDWRIFESSVARVSREGFPGSVAVLFDAEQHFAGAGLYDPESPVRVRVLTRSKQDPPVGEALFEKRIDEAAARRAGKLPPRTQAWRVLNGESDGFPGLVADRYADALVIKVYAACFLPWLACIAGVLFRRERGVRRLVVRLSRELSALAPETLGPVRDGMLFSPDAWDGTIEFEENSILFGADLVRGQKTGFFLDQRDNRARVGRLAKGRDVLNVFSYSGGFSLYAAQGGARSVTDIDADKHAIAASAENFERNPAFRAVPHGGLVGDAFEGMRRLHSEGKRYDLVVVDPPSFAKSAAEIPRALQSYARLATLAVNLIRKNGILVFASCSSRVTSAALFPVVEAAARNVRRPLRVLERTGHAVDHPAKYPESQYLKCLFAEVPG